MSTKPLIRILGSTLVLTLILGLTLAATKAGKTTEKPIRVAVFKGLGADPECLSDAVKALKIDASIEPEVLTAADIVEDKLVNCDALVFPGGGGARQMGNLGTLGQAKVLDFVKTKGRGVVGLCAGAYMLSDTPEYSCFHLIGLQAIDREHDERGHGTVRYDLTPHALDVFPELEGVEQAFMQYFEGPVLIPAKGGAFTPVALMKSDVHLENDAPAGMTVDKTFLAWAEAGNGRVFVSVGHPENTPGLRWMVPRMVRWTLRREAVRYGADVVRVKRNAAEKLFDGAQRKAESSAFQKLIYEGSGSSAPERKAAIASLVAMRSWGAKERIEGCLRDRDTSVRIAAAEALVELEHTAAIPSVRAAVATESDVATRAALERCSRALSAMTHGR